MTTTATIGLTSVFKLANGSATLTALGMITGIRRAGIKVDAIDATNMNSTSGAREYIPGMADYGSYEIDLDWQPHDATDQLILAALRATRTFEITYPSGAKDTGSCIVTDYSGAVPLDDKMTGTITVKVTGIPTFS
jgi:predicted secreted protein